MKNNIKLRTKKPHFPNSETKTLIKSCLKLILILKINFCTYFQSC